VLPAPHDPARRNVYHVEFSPRGDTFVSCGQDGTIRFWETATGHLKRVLRGHDGEVNCAAFSPDGTRLATGGDDGTIRLWSLSEPGDPAPVTIGKHDEWVLCILFTPDGRRLISGGRDGRVKLWDLTPGPPLAYVVATGEHIHGMAISPDGRTLATAASDRKVKIWDVDPLRERIDLAAHVEGARSVAFSHDGRRLASVGLDGEVNLWDPGQRQPLATGHGLRTAMQCVAFSPDDRTLATAGNGGRIQLWDAMSAQPLGVYLGESARLWCVAFSPDGRTLASCGDDGPIRLWDLDVPQDRLVYRIPVSEIHSIAIPAASNELVGAGRPEGDGSGRESVSLWDLAQGTRLGERMIAGPRKITQVVLSEDGRTLATAEDGHIISLWDLATGRSIRSTQFPARELWLRILGFSESQLVALEGDPRITRLVSWSLGTGSLHVRNDPYVTAVDGTVSGESLVTGADAGLIRWDLTGDGISRGLPPGLKGVGVSEVAVSRDGRQIASRQVDGSIYLWEARSLEWRGALTGAPWSVDALDFSPNGKVLATSTLASGVSLWDVASRQEMMSFDTVNPVGGDGSRHVAGNVGGGVQGRHIRFSPDGRFLVHTQVDGAKGYATVWSAVPQDSREVGADARGSGRP
jgi:WD40 repeat protein